jgi:hypothetical protein
MTSKIEQRKLAASELSSLVDDQDSRFAHFTRFLGVVARQMPFVLQGLDLSTIKIKVRSDDKSGLINRLCFSKAVRFWKRRDMGE